MSSLNDKAITRESNENRIGREFGLLDLISATELKKHDMKMDTNKMQTVLTTSAKNCCLQAKVTPISLGKI